MNKKKLIFIILVIFIVSLGILGVIVLKNNTKNDTKIEETSVEVEKEKEVEEPKEAEESKEENKEETQPEETKQESKEEKKDSTKPKTETTKPKETNPKPVEQPKQTQPENPPAPAPVEPQRNPNEFSKWLPLYTVTDENNFENNTAVTVWRITYTGYFTKVVYGLDGEVESYELDFTTYPGQGMVTVPHVKQYLRIPSDAELKRLAAVDGEFNAGTLYVVAGN